MILLIFMPLIALSDIPRVDALEVMHKGDSYYVFATTAHLKFEFGCVFDANTKEYLYEDEDFLINYFGNSGLELYKDVLTISHAKLWNEVDDYEDYYRDKNVISPLGDRVVVGKSEIMNIKLVGVIAGESAGRNIPQKITKSDETWINDYPLEKIAAVNGTWMCSYEIFAIKGNVSKEEARSISKRLENAYKEDYGGTSLQDDQKTKLFLDELLKRNILVLEFCSC